MHHSRTPLLPLLRSAPLVTALLGLAPGLAFVLMNCQRTTPQSAEMQRRGTGPDAESTYAHPDIRGVPLAAFLHPPSC